MANLRKFTLAFSGRDDEWKLTNDKTNRTLKTFDLKGEATAGGVLKRTLGEEGGSVKIQLKESKRIQEERTYPLKKDPRKSKG